MQLMFWYKKLNTLVEYPKVRHRNISNTLLEVETEFYGSVRR